MSRIPRIEFAVSFLEVKNMKIAGIGDNVIDRYMNMGIMFPGGNAVNVAAHAALLGAEAAYVGSIGADREGKILKNALESLGVEFISMHL